MGAGFSYSDDITLEGRIRIRAITLAIRRLNPHDRHASLVRTIIFDFEVLDFFAELLCGVSGSSIGAE